MWLWGESGGSEQGCSEPSPRVNQSLVGTPRDRPRQLPEAAPCRWTLGVSTENQAPHTPRRTGGTARGGRAAPTLGPGWVLAGSTGVRGAGWSCRPSHVAPTLHVTTRREEGVARPLLGLRLQPCPRGFSGGDLRSKSRHSRDPDTLTTLRLEARGLCAHPAPPLTAAHHTWKLGTWGSPAVTGGLTACSKGPWRRQSTAQLAGSPGPRGGPARGAPSPSTTEKGQGRQSQGVWSTSPGGPEAWDSAEEAGRPSLGTCPAGPDSPLVGERRIMAPTAKTNPSGGAWDPVQGVGRGASRTFLS